MLKNIWYCIKKTSEWYFALLVLYIILTLVNATIPILSAFLPKLVIEKLTLGSDIKGLIGTIMVFMGSIAVLTGVSKFLTKYLYFEKFSINVHYLKLVANKGLTTDYINQENGTFRKLQEESFLCCNGHSPLTQVYDVLQSFGTSVLGITVFSAVLYKLNVAVILFIVVTTAVSFYLNKRVVKWTDEHSKERMSYVQRLNYINAISGDARSAKDIRLYPMAKWFSDIYTDNMKGIAAWYHKLTKKLFSVTACDGALGLLREGIIYLYLIYLFMNGQISVADFVLYFGVVTGFSAWLSEIFAEVSVLNQLSTKINRFREYLDFPEEYLREGGLHPNQDKLPKVIELKNVSFRYEENQPYVLENFNLAINPGEHLAVVGLNGAGKTTLVKLICGLIDPTEGQVLYDGKSIAEYDRVELYRMYSAVFQQFSIMPVTVEEIVAEAPAAQVDSERVKKCLELAGMWERIQKLPNKLQSQFGRTIYEDGVEFSGGETQKLLLARAMYKSSPIMLLDEPLLTHIFSNFFYNYTEPGDRVPAWLESTCEKMKHPQNFIAGIDRMFQLSGKTREHVARCMKQYYHTTPTDFVSSLRLEHAAKLLLMSNLQVTDICYECGFDNLSWFYKSFSRIFGMTPAKYRNSIHKKHI